MAKTFADMVHRYEGNRYAFSSFLGLAEIDEFLRFVNDYPDLPYTLFGGRDGCERLMLRIGSVETLGYDEPFPIKIIRISPKSEKFVDALTHRDYLGALMHLGIERSSVGDILLSGKDAYIFCTEIICPYILENLIKIKHTTVVCEVVDSVPETEESEPKEVFIQVASERLDLILAKTYNLSRTSATELFRTKKVFVNGRLCENNSYNLKETDIVSVRGFGRLWMVGISGLSKKGKINMTVAVTK